VNKLDLTNITLAGLIAIGVVNVLTFWKPGIDSKIKFAISLAVAFAVTFIPLELGNIILDHAKTAISVAFAASGAYKVAQKIGGN
jgi:hypothetical protein